MSFSILTSASLYFCLLVFLNFTEIINIYIFSSIETIMKSLRVFFTKITKKISRKLATSSMLKIIVHIIRKKSYLTMFKGTFSNIMNSLKYPTKLSDMFNTQGTFSSKE